MPETCFRRRNKNTKFICLHLKRLLVARTVFIHHEKMEEESLWDRADVTGHFESHQIHFSISLQFTASTWSCLQCKCRDFHIFYRIKCPFKLDAYSYSHNDFIRSVEFSLFVPNKRLKTDFETINKKRDSAFSVTWKQHVQKAYSLCHQNEDLWRSLWNALCALIKMVMWRIPSHYQFY